MPRSHLWGWRAPSPEASSDVQLTQLAWSSARWGYLCKPLGRDRECKPHDVSSISATSTPCFSSFSRIASLASSDVRALCKAAFKPPLASLISHVRMTSM
jgi:hypothetical protein